MHSGLTTFPNVGYYHASKYALEGLSETLAKEMAPFGIVVTIVAWETLTRSTAFDEPA